MKGAYDIDVIGLQLAETGVDGDAQTLAAVALVVDHDFLVAVRAARVEVDCVLCRDNYEKGVSE
jgi:hypothetical protein